MLKVQQFLALPLLDRTFSLQPVNLSNGSPSDESVDGQFPVNLSQKQENFKPYV
jgi:hypothetical protein